jgi:hypothetical protein
MPKLRFRSFASATLPMLLPLMLVLVFAMHMRSLPQFLDFRLRNVPIPPEVVVPWLIAHGSQRSLLHDPHVIAYLALPLFVATAWMLHGIARARRPVASAIACMTTVVGTIYLGGLFGMWTSFFDGLARVNPRDVDGAVASFAALTSAHGAFLLTTTLAKLAFVGLAFQGLVLWDRAARARSVDVHRRRLRSVPRVLGPGQLDAGGQRSAAAGSGHESTVPREVRRWTRPMELLATRSFAAALWVLATSARAAEVWSQRSRLDLILTGSPAVTPSRQPMAP